MNAQKNMGTPAKLLQVCLLSLLVLTATAATLRADNMGYIDVKKVFTSYGKTQKAQADLETKEKAYSAAFDEKNKKIQEAKDKNQSEADVQKLIKQYEDELEPQKKEIVELNNRLSTELQQDIIKAVDAIAKELGVDIVLDKQVIITGGTDLTELVVARLNTSKSTTDKK